MYDEEYYSQILVKHFLPFLNKEVNLMFRKHGAKASSYYKYPEKNIKAGNLNPIFPHHLIKYGLFNEDRAELVFGFTEEGVYYGRTITSDDPNFKKKIDEERPFKEFKSSISPKLAIIMLNFLNLFKEREKKVILDPFVGNGTILMFGTIQDFELYGSDIDPNKVQNSLRNLNWLLKELEEPIPYLLNERVQKIDVQDLSLKFKENYFDGICCEPELGPFYKQKPYYNEVKELIESKLTPLYETTFREAEKVLKSKKRIAIIAPIINTIDGKDLQISINSIAKKYNFEQIPLINTDRIINKSNQKLQFKKENVKALLDAKKHQTIKRKIYVFERKY
jgi:tRNA G10  N-methylase Trm11